MTVLDFFILINSASEDFLDREAGRGGGEGRGGGFQRNEISN